MFHVDLAEPGRSQHLLQRLHRRQRAEFVGKPGLQAIAGKEADQRIVLVECGDQRVRFANQRACRHAAEPFQHADG